jgi:radical SAM superfamily enzyme YgiQ (UPF0313 family)
MKALFVYPPLGLGEERNLFQAIFPYGIAHAASHVLAAGYEAEVLDAYGEQYVRSEVEEKIRHSDADFFGLSGMSTQYAYLKWVAEIIHKYHPNKPIVCGGASAYYSANVMLEDSYIDVCSVGDGDEVMAEVMTYWGDLEKVKGIAYKDGDEVRYTLQRPPIDIENLLPLNDTYELFNMETYLQAKLFINAPSTRYYQPHSGDKTFSVYFSRGCPYSCRFCSLSTLTLRFKSAQVMRDEMLYLKERYQVKAFHFVDELFIVNKRRMMELADYIEDMNIIFDGQGRVNTVDEPTLKRLKEVGMVSVGYGVESGSNTILKAMKKSCSQDTIKAALNTNAKLQLHTKLQLIFGYPGENIKTITETVDFFNEIGHPGRRMGVITPIPGSPLYDQPEVIKKIKEKLGGEAKYLSSLYTGFGGRSYKEDDGCGQHVLDYDLQFNFTPFDDEEFWRVKEWAETTMQENYDKRVAKNDTKFGFLFEELEEETKMVDGIIVD